MSTTTSTFASSLILPSLNNPKTLSFHNPSKSLSLPVTTSSSVALKLQSFHPFSHYNLHSQNSSRFVRNVAVSSDFEEELLSGEEEPSFSEDLKLFVGNLPFNVDSAQLAELFKNAGNVEMVEVIYDKITGRSRGFGFVTMSTTQEVEAAAQQFNGYELDGRPLRVNYGPPPQKQSFGRGNRGGGGGGGAVDSSNRVYVGNLSWGVDNLALETLFSEQGKVLEAKVVYDRETGRSRGFGFVSYGSAEEVDCAVESLNGVELDGRAIRVSVAEARPPRRQF